MPNLYGLMCMLIAILVLGTFTWITWDQIAYSLKWARPTWGAGVGLVYLAFLANFVISNRIVMGRQIANPDNTNDSEAPQGGNRGRTEVREDPPSDLTPVG